MLLLQSRCTILTRAHASKEYHAFSARWVVTRADVLHPDRGMKRARERERRAVTDFLGASRNHFFVCAAGYCLQVSLSLDAVTAQRGTM